MLALNRSNALIPSSNAWESYSAPWLKAEMAATRRVDRARAIYERRRLLQAEPPAFPPPSVNPPEKQTSGRRRALSLSAATNTPIVNLWVVESPPVKALDRLV